MFIDTVTVFIKSGKGGDGAVSFHREKFIPRGGPDGGDGGDGGSVILIGDPNMNNLAKFKHSPRFVAENGQPGMNKLQYGKKGKDLKIRVPCGTIIRNPETQEVIFEILDPGQKEYVARGGKGGKGNYRFASSTNQTPRQFEKGKEGLQYKAILELKMIADIGLLGLPNAGKSSLITAVSHARPKIANYPFTTLSPHLGVIPLDNFRSLVMADIPGIIEGASEGKGLGIQFLKHVERTKVLLFIVDVSSYADTPPLEALALLEKEIEKFGHDLPLKQRLIAANKIDLDPDKEALDAFLKGLPAKVRKQVIPVSTVTQKGLDKLIERMDEIVASGKPSEIQE